MDTLADLGLEPSEAFLVAAKRIGAYQEALKVIDRLETADSASPRADPAPPAQPPPAPPPQPSSRRSIIAVEQSAATDEFMTMGILACGAGMASRAPALFGMSFEYQGDFYGRNLSLLVLPFLAGYFAWSHGLSARWTVRLAAVFAASAAIINLYPFDGDESGDTLLLAALHLPVLMWLAVGAAHCGGDWRNHKKRLDFVRFTGEWGIYYGMIAIGGTVLTGLAAAVFTIIGADVVELIGFWITPAAAAGSVVVAGWLADTRKGVLERLAPVLTRLFTPMFTVLMLSFLAAAIISGGGIEASRTLLIIFDVLLLVVAALVLYSVAARDPQAGPNIFDVAQTALVIAALLADLFVLSAMVDRLSEFGATPNRFAALGINLVLLVNLAGAAWLYVGFLRGRVSFERLERWQADYANVYAVWLAVVIVVLPPVFGFA
ncbi:MAG: hypothetical protein OXD37_03660 [Acidimicrobiaceae bacterium]|nr:hypothetical protein [Acidimicrobiaceae bacterium]